VECARAAPFLCPIPFPRAVLNQVPPPNLDEQIKNFKKEAFVDLDVSTHNLRVRGNVKILFYDYDAMGRDDKMFHCWFHTGYIQNNYLCFQKSVLDSACKDKKNKHFRPGFKMEIFLHVVEGDAKEFEDAEALDDAADPDSSEDEDGGK